MEKSRPDQLPGDVLAALRDGHKIKAIKLLRAAKGLGLKDAKDEVDRYMSHDPPVDRSAEKSAPGVWLLVFAASLAAAGTYFFGYFFLNE
ncbi:MAG: ribosomal protein L7/L12 [Gammaproteobacteria bacterium]